MFTDSMHWHKQPILWLTGEVADASIRAIIFAYFTVQFYPRPLAWLELGSASKPDSPMLEISIMPGQQGEELRGIVKPESINPGADLGGGVDSLPLPTTNANHPVSSSKYFHTSLRYNHPITNFWIHP